MEYRKFYYELIQAVDTIAHYSYLEYCLSKLSKCAKYAIHILETENDVIRVIQTWKMCYPKMDNKLFAFHNMLSTLHKRGYVIQVIQKWIICYPHYPKVDNMLSTLTKRGFYPRYPKWIICFPRG